MRSTVAMTVLWLVLSTMAQGGPPRSTARPPVDDAKVKAFLEAHRGAWRDMNVPESDGKLLYDLVVKNKYKSILEIGTSTGHSTIWLAWAASKTGGMVTTLEIDEERHKQALAHFAEAGVQDYVDARLGDAHQLVPELTGSFDFVFSDADKDWYTNYFIHAYPKLKVGGCFTAHNISMRRSGGAKEFMDYVRRVPHLETSVDTSGRGVSISYKRATAPLPDVASSLDAKVKAFLEKHRGTWRDMNVPESDGRLLHDLVVKNKYNSILEIGTSTGHSTIWLAWAASKTGGLVTTIEIDKDRQRQGMANLTEAGLRHYVDARLGDAHGLVKELEGPFDFVFSDADKEWYKNYFVDVYPKLNVGGCFTAHNVSMRGRGRGGAIQEFLDHLKTVPGLETTINTSSRAGVSISYKRRTVAPGDANRASGGGDSPQAPPEPAGMQRIFNGKDLTGWDGDPRLWSVRDGAIHGETTADNPARGNTFLIWKGGLTKDFHLRLSFRCTATNNSGIQYRSKHITEGRTRNPWVVHGYQHEIRNEVELPSVAGFIYDEGGKRGRMCLVGEKATWGEDGKKKVTDTLIDAQGYRRLFKLDDWNDVVIIAKGTHLQHYLNNTLILDCTDNHPQLARREGILALQLHAGRPMWVEFKDIRIQTLP